MYFLYVCSNVVKDLQNKLVSVITNNSCSLTSLSFFSFLKLTQKMQLAMLLKTVVSDNFKEQLYI